MMLRAVLLLCLLCAFPVYGQGNPVLSVEFDEEEIVVGQPLTIRVKILVSTWMPRPPEFPSFDARDLLVRLPERASGPVSERIDGETWSGIRRSYRVYPLRPGEFSFPAQQLAITYAQPGATDSVTEQLEFPEISFQATVPEGARTLDPLIIAESFALKEEIELPDDLFVGSAIVRSLTATIAGTTPILVPALSPVVGGSVFRVYPDDPKVIETTTDAGLAGTRTERVTYLATQPGDLTLPSVQISWYNLKTQKIEMAVLPERNLTIEGVAVADPKNSDKWLIRVFATIVVIGLLMATLIVLRPKVVDAIVNTRSKWRASEPYAHRQVLAAIRNRSLGAVHYSLGNWLVFSPHLDHDGLDSALFEAGKNRYGQETPDAKAQIDWKRLGTAYARTRTKARRKIRTARQNNVLPILNADA